MCELLGMFFAHCWHKFRITFKIQFRLHFMSFMSIRPSFVFWCIQFRVTLWLESAVQSADSNKLSHACVIFSTCIKVGLSAWLLDIIVYRANINIWPPVSRIDSYALSEHLQLHWTHFTLGTLLGSDSRNLWHRIGMNQLLSYLAWCIVKNVWSIKNKEIKIFKLELRPPETVCVNALDDFQLKVEWTAAVNQSESSFVIEWYPIQDDTVAGLSWKILNGSEKSFIITGV